MNYQLFNQALYNISQLNNYYNKNTIEIDYNNIVQEGLNQIPKQTIHLLVMGISFLIIYYYILPIWNKYFYNENLNNYSFKIGLFFISFALINILFYKYLNNIKIFYIYFIGYILLFISVWSVSKWLMKRRKKYIV